MIERIRTLFYEQGITVLLILTALPLTISTIVIAITGVFGGRDSASESPKGEEALKKWLRRLVESLKIPTGKSFEALPVFLESVFGAILSVLDKAVGFVAEYTWDLNAELIGVLLMRKVKK